MSARLQILLLSFMIIEGEKLIFKYYFLLIIVAIAWALELAIWSRSNFALVIYPIRD